MSNKKQNYKKQKEDLFNSELSRDDLCYQIIEARKHRDYYKINLKMSQRTNNQMKAKMEALEKRLKEVFEMI